MRKLPAESLKKVILFFFQIIAICKFGHWKLVINISKFILAGSFRLGQLIEDEK